MNKISLCLKEIVVRICRYCSEFNENLVEFLFTHLILETEVGNSKEYKYFMSNEWEGVLSIHRY